MFNICLWLYLHMFQNSLSGTQASAEVFEYNGIVMYWKNLMAFWYKHI